MQGSPVSCTWTNPTAAASAAWTDNGASAGSGTTATITLKTLGQHTIKLTVVRAGGSVASNPVYIYVQP